MLKCGGNIMDYYVLGDMPLYGVMKNMGNNYTLNNSEDLSKPLVRKRVLK